LGRPHLGMHEHEPRDQPRHRSDERAEDPLVGGCRAADGQDQHRADRDLENVVAQPQRVPDDERYPDRDRQAPPGEAEGRGQSDGEQYADDNGRDLGEGGPQRLVEADLGHEQRGQRRQHRRRPGDQLLRDQVGEGGGHGQPDDDHRRGLRPVADHGEGLRRGPRGDPDGGAERIRALPVAAENRDAHGVEHYLGTNSRHGTASTGWVAVRDTQATRTCDAAPCPRGRALKRYQAKQLSRDGESP
jgi:hypothetical protein